MKLTERDLIDLERYKRIIDEDFENFPNNKRLVQLVKAWISCISHRIMPKENQFIHDDRKKLRKELIKYLNKKNNTQKYPILKNESDRTPAKREKRIA